MARKDLAMDYFSQGYNCAQAVALAFSDSLPLDRDTLAKLASSFGGGLGRLREVCGCVSGMSLVAGLLYADPSPEDSSKKAEHYARIQALAKEFEAQNGSIVCRELLGLTQRHDAPVPEARTSAYYQKRPCKELVGMAAEILENYMRSHPIP